MLKRNCAFIVRFHIEWTKNQFVSSPTIYLIWFWDRRLRNFSFNNDSNDLIKSIRLMFLFKLDSIAFSQSVNMFNEFPFFSVSFDVHANGVSKSLSKLNRFQKVFFFLKRKFRSDPVSRICTFGKVLQNQTICGFNQRRMIYICRSRQLMQMMTNTRNIFRIYMCEWVSRTFNDERFLLRLNWKHMQFERKKKKTASEMSNWRSLALDGPLNCHTITYR